MGSAAVTAAVHPHKETPNTGNHTTVRTYRNSGNLSKSILLWSLYTQHYQLVKTGSAALAAAVGLISHKGLMQYWEEKINKHCAF